MRRARGGAGLLLAVVCLGAAPASERWTFTASPHGLATARVASEARLGTRVVPATVEIHCHPAPDGAASVELHVHGDLRGDGFHLDDFEGPDAPAQARELLQVTISGPSGEVSLKGAVAGWWADADTFVFGWSARAHRPSGPRQVIEALASGATSWHLRLQPFDGLRASTDFGAPGSVLVVEVPLAGAADAAAKVVAACKPEPAPGKGKS